MSASPGAALALTVIAFNLLGDELRNALDPRWRGPELAQLPLLPDDLGAGVPPARLPTS